MKILACDDERPALQSLTRAIKNAGYGEAVAFRYPLDVLEWVKENPVDVAFLDISMPEMSGIDLAKELKKILPRLNVIFVTAYSHYAIEAIGLHASGYVVKPVSSEAVKREMENLLVEVEPEMPHAYARTFGTFDFFVDGKPLKFDLAKSKEMLAYLIDRRGSSVSKKDIAAVLFEFSAYTVREQDYLVKIYKALRVALESVGLGDVLVKGFNSYAVDVTKFGCDLYDYDKGDPKAISAYHGEYMMQYEWSGYSL